MNRNPAILLVILLLSYLQSWGAALQMQEELLWYAVDYANAASNGEAEDWQQKSTRIDVDEPAGRVGTAYDPIGNRKFSLTDEDITAGHDGDYTSNSLNQYILRRTGEGFSVSGFVDSADASRSAGAAVAVLNSQGEYEFAMLENYKLTDEGYFWAKLSKSAPTETEARFEQIRTYGALAGTYASALDGPQNADEADAIGYKDELLLVPPKIQGFAYDADGNLLTDNLWAYEYDAENRPVRIYRGTSAAPFEALTFVYDYLGRRVKKTYHNSTDPTRNYTIAFLWQGWSLLAELRTNGTVKRSFDWGLDLSASIGGAGGIGALLAMHDHDQGQTHLFSYDANGNVSALINRSSAEVSAAYEYDPFGNLVRKTGSYADSNPFRFSTKYYDSESRLSYFGFRYYSPDLGRFINQDLIEEQGAWVLYNTLSTSTTTPLAGAPTIGASDLRSTWQERQDSLLSAFMTTYGSEMVGIAGKRNSTDSTTRFAGTTAFSANASTHFTITPRLPQGGASDFSLPSGGYSGPSNVDTNLYAFVGNDPINGYDAYGLNTYLIDGTAFDVENNYNGGFGPENRSDSNVWDFFNRIDQTGGEIAQYFGGPGTFGKHADWNKITGGDVDEIARDVYNVIASDLKAGTGNGTVNLVGWSRGAVAAVEVARLLEGDGIDVNFLGLYDAVEMVRERNFDGSVVNDVDHFAHAMKTGGKYSGGKIPMDTVRYGHPGERAFDLFTPRRKWSNNPNVYYINDYNSTHGDIGVDRTNSGAHQYIIDSAKAAGIPFLY